MKIQEMAFVLLAIMVFFALVLLIYFAIKTAGLKEDVGLQRQEAAKQLAMRLSGVPEFSWAGCSGCVDADKIIELKGRKSYENLWGLDYLMVERVTPELSNVECTSGNYPQCGRITIISKTLNIGTPVTAFVALCSFNADKGGYEKCELGRIYASGKAVE